jgi:SSS family solute:Na+ symporter
MVFLGLVMMAFYYGAEVRSVPEYLRLRFNEATHAFNAGTFALATVLISGVNLFALALIIHLMLGWSVTIAILVAAALVMVYITLGGLTSAIYNEVLQFFVIVAALLPLTLVALYAVGGIHGLVEKVKHFKPLGEAGLHAWRGLGIHHVTNPLASDWVGIVFGLGFVLGFGYWTTNFAEVQRALSARNMSASRRTPLIGAFPKIFQAGDAGAARDARRGLRAHSPRPRDLSAYCSAASTLISTPARAREIGQFLPAPVAASANAC